MPLVISHEETPFEWRKGTIFLTDKTKLPGKAPFCGAESSKFVTNLVKSEFQNCGTAAEREVWPDKIHQ